MNRVFEVLPDDLPEPMPDGAERHLLGSRLPDIVLGATSGKEIRLAELLKPTVLFFYPRTGVPNEPEPGGWDCIAGARGCTPQCVAFADFYERLLAEGVEVFGVSTQTTMFQREFRERKELPFELLSDHQLELVRAMRLPTFEFPVVSGGPNVLTKRMAWLVHEGRILKVWYPVFPSNECARRVYEWIQPRASLLRGVVRGDVQYALESQLSSGELSRVYDSSGIGRPTSDAARMSDMLAHSNVVITARTQDAVLVGVLRGSTDFSWFNYVSDLAVAKEHQNKGIGRELLSLARDFAGPGCTLLLNAAPSASTYYPQLGLQPLESGWSWRRER